MTEQYIQNGTASHTLVFIHGWCCSPDDFYHQAKFFAPHFNIYIPDYSEITASNKNCHDNLFYFCVDKIKEKIIQRSLENIIFIGHSMGGNMALCLANLLHEKTRGIVIIDTTMPITIASIKKFKLFLSQLANSNTENIIREFINDKMINLNFDDQLLMKEITNKMCTQWQSSPKNFEKLLKDVFSFDSAMAIKMCRYPILYIGGTPPSGDIKTLKLLNPTILISCVKSGHFVMLNQPEETNQLLSTFFQNVF